MIRSRHASRSSVRSRGISISALRKRATDKRTPFDYDAPVEGLQVLDRYTMRIRLERPNPRHRLADQPADGHGTHRPGTDLHRVSQVP